MTYVYMQSEPSLWTVGFCDLDGNFYPESDHETMRAAADRVAFLNGGGNNFASLQEEIERLRAQVAALTVSLEEARLDLLNMVVAQVTGEEAALAWEGEP